MVQVVRKSNANLWSNIASFIKTYNGAKLKVGWFSTMHYEDGTPVAYAATIHEFGSPKANIPPRPFMRPTMAKEEGNYRRFIEQETPKILDGRSSVHDLFEALGLAVSGDIAKTIAELMTPELKDATIKARVKKLADGKTIGSLTKPLVETSIMKDSLTFTTENTE